MAKQTELRELVNALVNAVAAHARTMVFTLECSQARDRARDAEKRIFSLFDRINNDRLVAERIANDRKISLAASEDQLRQAELTIESLTHLVGAQPGPQYKPFDVELARKGVPIEALWNHCWYPAHFVGIGVGKMAVVECEAAHVTLSYWDHDALRMAITPKTRELQLFANVRADPDMTYDGTIGWLYPSEQSALAHAAPHGSVRAFPVKVTVAE